MIQCPAKKPTAKIGFTGVIQRATGNLKFVNNYCKEVILMFVFIQYKIE